MITIPVEGSLLSLPAAAWLAFLIELACKGSLLLLVGLVLTAALKRRSAAIRSLIWSVVFVVLAVAPILLWVLTASPLEHSEKGWLAPLAGHVVTVRLEQHDMAIQPPLNDRAATSAVYSQPAQPNPRPWWPGWAAFVVCTWMAGSVVLLGRLARSLGAGWLALRKARQPTAGELLGLASTTREILGPACLVEVRIGPARSVPYVVGVWRPVLVVPEDALCWKQEALRAVLLHELAHVQRGDFCTLLLIRLGCAVLWFNPLVWWAGRRAKVEIEIACDDRVLGCGARAVDYARQLLELAVTVKRSARPPATVVAMAEHSQLEERVTMILDPMAHRKPVSRAAAAASLFIAMALVVPALAAVQLVDRVAAPDERAPVAPAPPALVAIREAPAAPEPVARPAPGVPPAPAAAPAPAPRPVLAAVPAVALPQPPAPDDDELSKELQQLIDHIAIGVKKRGRVSRDDLPEGLVRSLIDHVLERLPEKGEGMASIAATSSEGIMVRIQVHRKGDDCTEPTTVALRVDAGDDDTQEYTMIIRCGD